MGWYFRKSKSVGPFRVNFSKSGMSFSTGVKGARMSFGPRGTFVNVGGNGIYYRKKLGSSSKGNSTRSKSYVQNGSAQYAENYTQTVDAITVQEQTQGISVTNQAIVKDIKRAQLLNWLWVALSVILLACVGWWTAIIMLWEFMLYYRIIPFTTTSDLDEQIDIDHIEEYSPQNDTEENFKRLVSNFGMVDTAEKAFELNSLLNADEFDSIKAKGIISSNLISILQGNS